MPAAAHHALASTDPLADLPNAVFVERWRLITGEPPAALLSSRTAMIALLVESAPVAPLAPQVQTRDARNRDPHTVR